MKQPIHSKFVVTGGGGFVGKALCKKLREQGHEVVSISRRDYPELRALGVTTIQLDIARDLPALLTHVAGAQGVFHTAAKVEMWGSYEEFYEPNVVGTRNVIEACKVCGVGRLVYTSSPSVIADGTNLRAVDESYPYPQHFEANYPRTKAQAEREVLAADTKAADTEATVHTESTAQTKSTEQNLDANSSLSPPVLRTLSLRPHLIWGPGDTNLIPRILARAQSGRLIGIGTGNNMVDICFIDDCVDAHLNAMEALATNPSAGGNAYFISQGEPVNFWNWISDVCERSGYSRVTRFIPASAARVLATVFEFFCRTVPGLKEPFITTFVASELSTDHYFNIAKARTHLGFVPRFTVAQGMDITFPPKIVRD